MSIVYVAYINRDVCDFSQYDNQTYVVSIGSMVKIFCCEMTNTH